MGILDKNFSKVLRRKVNDCSNPIHIRFLLSKYRTYVFTKDVIDIFYKKINLFKVSFTDKVMVEALEEAIDIIDEVTVDGAEPELDLPYQIIDEDSIFKNLLKAIDANNGNKIYMCRYLKINSTELNILINKYNLKTLLNTERRKFRKYAIKKESSDVEC